MFGELDRRLPLRSRGIGAMITQTSAQTIVTDTMTTLIFDKIIRDEYKLVDLPNNRIVLPKDGWYILTGFIVWDFFVGGFRYIRLFVNNAITPAYINAGTNGGDGAPCLNIGAGYYGQKGDYVQLQAYNASGTTRHTSLIGSTSASLSVCRVGA
jgi:hypothetical protein